jgi:zinc transporter, ZIP family
MPIARFTGFADRTRAILAAIAVGILLFLFVDVLINAHTLVLGPLPSNPDLTIEYAAVLGLGFAAGVLLLVAFERAFSDRLRRHAEAKGTAAPGEHAPIDPLQLSTLIAVGIGLHNFSEGLAIGTAYAQGVLALVTVLVIGFALHNATEGFGILGPGMMAGRTYSWRRILALGLIAGGPTFLGTAIGSFFTADVVSILFYALAAGAILYVVLQMSRPMLAPATRTVVMVAIVAGFLLGYTTDVIVTLGGA